MAKAIFVIGYAIDVERPGGVWIKEVQERSLKGDLIRASVRQNVNDSVNGTLSLTDSASVVADAYAMEHFSAISPPDLALSGRQSPRAKTTDRSSDIISSAFTTRIFPKTPDEQSSWILE